MNGFRSYLLALAAAVTAGGIADALAEKAEATATATVIEAARVTNKFVPLTTASFVSSVTGDLSIRIAAAVTSALQDAGLEQPNSAGQENLTFGVLAGNPVNSITIGAVDAQTDGRINVIIAYN